MEKKMKILGIVIIVAIIGAIVIKNVTTEQKAKTITLKLAENHPADYPTSMGDKEFARLVAEKSGGRITIEVFTGAQLGDERSVIEQLKIGGIDFARVSMSPMSAFAPQLNALQMPYLYRDAEHEWKVLKGEIGDEILSSLDSKGFVGLTYYESGARNFYTTKKEVRTLADMKGLKIRVQESPLMMDLVKSLGAIPTPMPYGDVYSAMKTGIVDGAENNYPSYDSAAHFEVAKYYVIDEHNRVPEIVVASKKTMDKLSKEDQAIIREAAKESTEYQIEQWKSYEQKSEDKVKKAGSVITTLSAEEKQKFMDAMKPMYDKLPEDQKALVQRIRAVK